VEELVSFVEEYASLDASNRDLIRRTIAARAINQTIRILGNPPTEKPALSTLFDLMTMHDLFAEMQITDTIRITYQREKGPQVFYWTRTMEGG
jgi:hypothetical protein